MLNLHNLKNQAPGGYCVRIIFDSTADIDLLDSSLVQHRKTTLETLAGVRAVVSFYVYIIAAFENLCLAIQA